MVLPGFGYWQRRREAAERAAAAKAHSLANMSPEAQTLTALPETGCSPKRREYSETVRNSSGMPLENISFSPRAVVESVLGLLSEQARSKGLELQFECGEHVPTDAFGDPGRLRQVLSNLVGNALKFTKHGYVLVRCECGLETDQSFILRFAVQDTGIGISAGAIPNLFEAFTPAEGAGLAIARQIVKLMGGEIGVESEPGHGSTFRFTVRLQRAPLEPRATNAVAPATRVGHGRVLLVEDNIVNQKVAAHLLRKFGCQVDVAANGVEAVRMWRTLPYGAIFMDCQMPEMDGYEATAAIRKAEPQEERIPIVAMTAHAMTGDRKRCLDAGMDDYISKPVSLVELRAIIARWMPPAPQPEPVGSNSAD